MRTYYILRGAVTDTEAHGGRAKIGDVEWQFSDHPTQRSSSADFLTLEEGLAALSPAVFHWGDGLPPLSPSEANAAIRADGRDPLHVGDWVFYLDGPMGTPHRLMAPAAYRLGCDDQQFCTSGSFGDPIDSSTTWVLV